MQKNSCRKERSKKDGLMETERKRIARNKGGEWGGGELKQHTNEGKPKM